MIVRHSFGGFGELYMDLIYFPFSDGSKRENRVIFCCFCDNTTIAINQPQQGMYLYLLVINSPHWADICICTDFHRDFLPQILILTQKLCFGKHPFFDQENATWVTLLLILDLDVNTSFNLINFPFRYCNSFYLCSVIFCTLCVM